MFRNGVKSSELLQLYKSSNISELAKRLRYKDIQTMMDDFWKVWKNEK